MDLSLRGRACIVTGASRGIGLATATRLRHEGADVLLVGRDEPRLTAVARDLEAAAVVADVTLPNAAEEIVVTCIERFGRVDVLVNNAGSMRRRPLAELTDDEWTTQWELNVMAPMRLMRAAAPHMVRQRFGRIVNVSSSAAKRPSAANGAYSVSKAAQLSLSRVFADALAPHDVLVNAITPGPVTSPLWMDSGGLADQAAHERGVSRDEVLSGHAQSLPVRRLGTPDEVAAAIVFLCSAPASFIAGAAWSVDGGAVATIV